MRNTLQNLFAVVFLAWGYVERFGWPLMVAANYPEFVNTMENLGTFLLDWALIILGVLLLVSANWKWVRDRIIHNKKAEWVPLIDGVDYLILDSKLSLPSRKGWLVGGISGKITSALIIYSNAMRGELKLKGRKLGSKKFKIIDSDILRLTIPDFEELCKKEGLEAGKTVQSIDQNIDTLAPDLPKVPEFVDLMVDINALRLTFPPQTRWDKSTIGRWLRRKRLHAFRRKLKIEFSASNKSLDHKETVSDRES